MTPEQKVPTRETCQALVDAGVRFKTERHWERFSDGASGWVWMLSHGGFIHHEEDCGRLWLPAPDLNELADALKSLGDNNPLLRFYSSEDAANRILIGIRIGTFTPAAVNAAIERKEK